MQPIRILHLSDLHLMNGLYADQRVVLDALFADLRDLRSASGPIDLIFFTGDLVGKGTFNTNVLESLDERFFAPLLESAGTEASAVFIVPGNHDVEQSKRSAIAKLAIDGLKTIDEVNRTLDCQPDRFSKAINSGADIVVIDLEDAVEVDAKADARRAVASWIAPDRKVLLRVNANGTPWFTEDAQIAKLRGIAGIVLPKAESAADVVALVSLTKTKIPVFPLIETARGMWNVHGLRQRCNFSSLSEPLA